MIELSRIGERGQIVIPQKIRKKISASKGTAFTVMAVDDDTVILKKLDQKKLLAEFDIVRDKISKKFSETEIAEEIKEYRKNKGSS